MNKEMELKQCPFCGGEPELAHWHTDEWNVCCKNCKASAEQWTDKSEAIKAWNTRKGDKNGNKEIEELAKKFCRVCNKNKNINEFSKCGTKKGVQKYHYFCKDCLPDSYKIKNRNYFREYRKSNKKKLNEMDKERLKDPIRKHTHRARYTVSHAIRAKILIKSDCEICGDKAQAHHDNYNKPLEVRWLCIKHHKEWHRHNKPIYPFLEK